jgi:hypothetical protein
VAHKARWAQARRESARQGKAAPVQLAARWALPQAALVRREEERAAAQAEAVRAGAVVERPAEAALAAPELPEVRAAQAGLAGVSKSPRTPLKAGSLPRRLRVTRLP